jgi:glucuronate isomerase
VRVFPAFRPDKALAVDTPQIFNAWADRLAEAANTDIRSLPALLEALKKRHDYFHAMGCRLSDHGLDVCYADPCPEAAAAAIFDKVRSGRAADPAEKELFASYLMLFFGRLDAEKGWTKQLHLGAKRNVNTLMYQLLGPDTGFDAMGDWPQIDALAQYLDRLNQDGALPKMIIYNNNPVSNYAFSTLAGCFQDGSVPAKIQFGSGWWHLDQKEGIEWQLNALSSTGLLARFVGMLTDSRSFMSFPRHEYFRRVLCNLVGRDVDNGEIPSLELAGQIVRRISYANAREYLALPL